MADSQADNAIDQSRSAAKWIIAAFAAIGGSLVAGLQLSVIGKLHGTDLTLALAGLVLAIGSVAFAIKLVARVLTPDLILLDELEEQLGDLIERDPTLLRAQADDLDTFLRRRQEALDTYRGYRDASIEDPENETLATAAAESRESLEAFESTANWLRGLALAQKVRTALLKMWRPLTPAIAGVLLGLVVFAYAANHESEKASPPPRPHTSKAVGQTPVGVRLRLSHGERRLLSPLLGPRCASAPLWGMAIGGRAVALDVVTIPTPRCQPVRLVVTPRSGIVIHRSPAPRVALAVERQRAERR